MLEVAGGQQVETESWRLGNLSVLVGEAAHAFNNLLVGILGHSSLALDKLPPSSPARSNVEKALEAAERASDVARQLLACSSKGGFMARSIDLNVVVRSLDVLEKAAPKATRVTFDLSETPTLLRGNLERIRQVVVNLVVNALEAIGDDEGKLTLSSGFETVSASQTRSSRFTGTELSAGRYVFLEVRDDGPGMSKGILSRVFEPFFTTKPGAPGLGLPAMLAIVRGHDGGIHVESEPGRGTRVRVLFPAKGEAPAATGDLATDQGGAKRAVLVIDDDEVVRTALDDMLVSEGMRVLMAADGACGVALYRQRRAEIGLVVLDLSMPGMSGEETLRELRRVDPRVTVIREVRRWLECTEHDTMPDAGGETA